MPGTKTFMLTLTVRVILTVVMFFIVLVLLVGTGSLISSGYVGYGYLFGIMAFVEFIGFIWMLLKTYKLFATGKL